MNNEEILKRVQQNKNKVDERETILLKESIAIANKATTIMLAILFLYKSIVLDVNAFDILAIMFANCGILYFISYRKLKEKSYLLKSIGQFIGVLIFIAIFLFKNVV